MDQSKILIIGAYGQLGQELQLKYPDATAVDSDSLDITNMDALRAYDWSKINTVINAAAYTNVDGAETAEGREIAWRVNAVGPANLAKIATEKDLTLVHISSEYVFDGAKSPHKENEPLTPLGVYAQTKAAGDIAVSLIPKHYLLRTSWVVGKGKNFIKTMLELGNKGISPSVVNDQIGRLTFTSELTRAIDHLLSNKLEYGTYNVSNEGNEVSWADVASAVFTEAGHTNLTVTGVTTQEYYQGKQGVAPRPSQSTLDLNKLHATGFTSNNWQEDLKLYIQAEQGDQS